MKGLSDALLISLLALDGKRSQLAVDAENANIASLFIKQLTRLTPLCGAQVAVQMSAADGCSIAAQKCAIPNH